jgi:hypothetical protein
VTIVTIILPISWECKKIMLEPMEDISLVLDEIFPGFRIEPGKTQK